MGNKQSCCIYHSPKGGRKSKREEIYQPTQEESHMLPQPQSTASLPGVPHISEREPEGEDLICIHISVRNSIMLFLLLLGTK